MSVAMFHHTVLGYEVSWNCPSSVHEGKEGLGKVVQ